MSTPAAVPSPPPAGEEIDALAAHAAAVARKLAATTERERALPPALLEELRATGLMRAGVPAALGALEAAPATTLRGAEASPGATRRRAGASRSPPPAACSPPTSPRRAPPRSSATPR